MKKPFTAMLAALLTLGATIPAFAQPMSDRPGYWHDGWWGSHMLYGSLMMILFWGGIILLVVLAIRWIGGGIHHSGGTPAHGPRPIDILEERFARGEIDKDEFEDRKRVLSK